jgi:hypothetical protein
LSILFGVAPVRGEVVLESYFVKSALGTGYLLRLLGDGDVIDVVMFRNIL